MIFGPVKKHPVRLIRELIFVELHFWSHLALCSGLQLMFVSKAFPILLHEKLNSCTVVNMITRIRLSTQENVQRRLAQIQSKLFVSIVQELSPLCATIYGVYFLVNRSFKSQLASVALSNYFVSVLSHSDLSIRNPRIKNLPQTHHACVNFMPKIFTHDHAWCVCFWLRLENTFYFFKNFAKWHPNCKD